MIKSQIKIPRKKRRQEYHVIYWDDTLFEVSKKVKIFNIVFEHLHDIVLSKFKFKDDYNIKSQFKQMYWRINCCILLFEGLNTPRECVANNILIELFEIKRALNCYRDFVRRCFINNKRVDLIDDPLYSRTNEELDIMLKECIELTKPVCSNIFQIQ